MSFASRASWSTRRPRSSSCSITLPPTPARSTPETRCSTRCGALTTSETRAPSTCTSSACAKSSTASPTSGTSKRCGAWATNSRCWADARDKKAPAQKILECAAPLLHTLTGAAQAVGQGCRGRCPALACGGAGPHPAGKRAFPGKRDRQEGKLSHAIAAVHQICGGDLFHYCHQLCGAGGRVLRHGFPVYTGAAARSDERHCRACVRGCARGKRRSAAPPA